VPYAGPPTAEAVVFELVLELELEWALMYTQMYILAGMFHMKTSLTIQPGRMMELKI
jgi:hypothetical protein